VDKRESKTFYNNFGSESNIIMYRPKRMRYAEFKAELTEDNLFLFIDGVLAGSAKYVKMENHPSFITKHEDL
jgi:hypothetical protein